MNRRLASAILAAAAAAAAAVFAAPTLGQTLIDPWENTPDFTGAWEMGDVFVGVGAPSWWPGMNPGEWVILREESDLVAHPLGYSFPGIAVRDTADPARGFFDDPTVEGFAAGCVVDPVTGNLWTADSFGFVTQFDSAPTMPSPPTVRDIVSRIKAADFVPPGGPAAPNALAIDGTGPGRRLWLGTYDYFGDFWDENVDVAGAMLGFDLPHVQGNPLSVTGFHQPPVTNGGIYKMDFASDGETMVYTSFDKQVMVYNVNDPTVAQPFGPPLPVLGVNDFVFDVRVLPPGNYDPVQNSLEGGLLVATYSRIYRLDQHGNMIQAYEPGTGDTAPGGTPDFWYLGVIISADRQSFWSATYTDGVSKSGYLYKVNIATGMVELGPINLGLDGAWSLCVKGEFRAAVSVINQTPTANAGPDQPAVEATGAAGAPVTLDGSLSADPNPLDTLGYTWTGTFPEGGGTVTGASPVVTLALGGPHTTTLAVADPWGATHSDTVTVTVQDTTSPLLTLSATSIDVDPTTPTGAPVDVLAASGATATDVVDASPVLSHDAPAEFPTATATPVTITATDATGNATSQQFTVTVRNVTPTANAGPDQTAVEATGPAGASVTLDGSASADPDPFDTPSYTWTGPFPEGGGTVTGVSPVVTLALGGPHTVTLTVADPWGATHSDTVAITVQDTTDPQLTLTATSIDVDPTTSTGALVDVLAVAGALASDVADPSPALAHDGPAEFPTAATTLVTITATDASGNATSQQFSVTVRNAAPTANGGPDQPTVEATSPSGAPVTLDGSASADPDPFDTLSYTWTGPFSEGGGTVTGESPVVTLALGGPHTITLSVEDPWGETHGDTVAVTVQDTTAPQLTLTTTSIAVDPTTPTGAPVDVLAASGASATDIADASPVLSHDAPAEFPTAATTLVTITATDASGNATSQQFSVTVRNAAPTAHAGADQPAVEATGPSGAPVTLDGSASADPDPFVTLTYSWTGPFSEGGGTVTGVSPVVTLAIGGPHTVSLTVTHPWGETHSDTVAITLQDTTAPQLTLTTTSTEVDPTTPTGAPVDVLAASGASATDIADPSPVLSHDALAEFATGSTTQVTITATDASGNATSQQFTVTVRTPEEGVENIEESIQFFIDANPGSPVAATLADALSKIQDALAQIGASPPDNQAAMGNLEGAVGDLEAAVGEGLDTVEGASLMDQTAGIARVVAETAIADAIARGGDAGKISDAQDSFDEGDTLRASGDYKDAVAKYKDALSSAEGA